MTRVVLKLGGGVAADSLEVVRERHAAGDEVVVVHGAGPQITAELQARGIPVRFLRGRRFTDPATLAVVRSSLIAVGAELSAALGPAAVHLVGDEIGLEALPVAELGLVGEPIPGRLETVAACLDAGRIPVVTPIAVGPLNVNADEAATAIAASVAADRVVFVSDVAWRLPRGRCPPAHPCRSREPAHRERRLRRRHRAQAHGGGAGRPVGPHRRDRRDGGGRVTTTETTRLERLLPTYARADLTIVRGDGCRVWDSDGREYLDFGGGIAVVSLGHCHPAPLAAAHAQLERLWHVSNLYRTEPAEQLAAALSDRFGGAQSFFCNSGAEAIEAAVKYARKATGKPGVVALEGGFHGRTFGALSVTGQPAKRAPFAPLVPGIRFVSPNDVDALIAAVDDEVGLILLEPILGEGGVVPLDREFVAAAAELAPLLCFDEVQTGVGRTGSFFAFEQLGVRPDLLTLAKGLANGLPIGALLVADDAAGAFAPGDHGSTFGGNPVSAAAASAVVEAIDDELLANVQCKKRRARRGPRCAVRCRECARPGAPRRRRDDRARSRHRGRRAQRGTARAQRRRARRPARTASHRRGRRGGHRARRALARCYAGRVSRRPPDTRFATGLARGLSCRG